MKSTKSHQKRNVIRFTARALAVLWGVVWITFNFLRMYGNLTDTMELLLYSAVCLMILAIVFIPFKWEAAGGILLILLGLFFYVLYLKYPLVGLYMPRLHDGGLPLIAGILFLISWWESRALRTSHA
jgi:uncharacterized membrane protein YhaH (DUF805 family)